MEKKKKIEPRIAGRPTPLTAALKVKEAIDDMEKWMNSQHGSVPLIVYRSRTNSLRQFVKIMEERRMQIERL